MSKTKKSVKREAKEVRASQFVDRKLMGVNPEKEQFEPTPASPVRQHAKMAGQP